MTLDLVESSDSGLYECRPDKLDPVSVNLHVIKGKNYFRDIVPKVLTYSTNLLIIHQVDWGLVVGFYFLVSSSS